MKKALLKTDSDGNFVKLSCMNVYNIPEYNYFPTYNGIDPFLQIECTENGWSLPDNMKPIKCQHIFCPPLDDVAIYVGEEIELVCDERDFVCTHPIGVPDPYHENINDEKYQHCECKYAVYKCKKESQSRP